MTDNINNPSHYQGRYGLEAIDAMRNFMTVEEVRGFYKGNALKYILRHRTKNGLEDLKKARRNLDYLIEDMEVESDGTANIIPKTLAISDRVTDQPNVEGGEPQRKKYKKCSNAVCRE